MVLDRTGEPIDDDAHPQTCSGWIGGRNLDNPKPCLICKPWLDPAERRRALLDADHLRATRPTGETDA